MLFHDCVHDSNSVSPWPRLNWIQVFLDLPYMLYCPGIFMLRKDCRRHIRIPPSIHVVCVHACVSVHNKLCLSHNLKTTEANWEKLHRKIKHKQKVCWAQEFVKFLCSRSGQQ